MPVKLTWITRLALLLLIVLGISGYVSVFSRRVPPFQTSWNLLLTANLNGTNNLYLFNGTNLQVLTENRIGATQITWSPDGTRIAFEGYREITSPEGPPVLNREIWVMDADGSNIRAITNSPDDELMPVWSPDSSTIAYISDEGYLGRSTRNLFITNVDNPNPIQVTQSIGQVSPPSWSPDGTLLVLGFIPNRYQLQGGSYDLNIIDMTTPQYPMYRLTNEPFTYNGSPKWSPSGEYIAFITDRGGQGQSIYIYEVATTVIFPLLPSPYVTGNPAWSPDGKKLVFTAADPTSGHTYRNLFIWDTTRADKPPERLLWAEKNHSEPQWSPDGSQIVFVEDQRIYARFGISGYCDIVVYDLATRVQTGLFTPVNGVCYNTPQWQPSP